MNDISDDLRRDRSAQYAVAIVSRRDKIVLYFGCAEDWQLVRRARPQSRPRLLYPHLSDSRHEFGRLTLHAQYRLRLNPLVKANSFHRGSDQDTSIASRHEIDFLAANTMFDDWSLVMRIYHRQHLSFY